MGIDNVNRKKLGTIFAVLQSVHSLQMAIQGKSMLKFSITNRAWVLVSVVGIFMMPEPAETKESLLTYIAHIGQSLVILVKDVHMFLDISSCGQNGIT